ncbi:pyridoxal-phosphate-dependent aminotransferase family protein [Desulfurococcus amylolyticus]|uniref:Aminotransferase class V n=1 Tax=Desulfurococcus amylolyticus DSM 16532 TaxID=768672 RepID=I3XT48_DESAM|nr:alanine--glyoxylate aminotransferase family protein [Desulfurococcus amylolyticus]AFL67122.1 aminotransferase class V [Desulfurococcus amylolyticus DSM 16532]
MSERRLVMVPGPINYEPSVLRELAVSGLDHTSPEFVEIFADALGKLREIVYAGKEHQPVVIAGTGTLGMEASVTNFLTKGNRVLVVSNGYFGDRFKELLSRYPVKTDVLRPDTIGNGVEASRIIEVVEKEGYDLVTLTHVDTSTGVLQPIREVGKKLRNTGTILVVDGVCSVGGEEINLVEDGVDVLFTGSQKALGVPPGLAIIWLSPKALEKLKELKEPLSPYYMDLKKWVEVMRSYEEKKPVYFGTPAVNLVVALRKSLELILREGMENRVRRHMVLSEAFREAMKALGLGILASEKYTAHTITAVKLPSGIDAGLLVSFARSAGVAIARGLLKEVNYFRVGHMGPVNANDIIATIAVIERALYRQGYLSRLGDGLLRAQEVLARHGF